MLLSNIHFENKRLAAGEVAAKLRSLPSAPRVLPQLYTLLRDSEPTLQQVSALLRLDAGLTSRILQKGNRLFAARGDHCLSVEDAINAVGFDAIHSLVSQVADEQIFSRPIGLYGLDAEEFWRRSISCALAGEVIAEHAGEDVDTAYMAGLFHEVGMVAVDEAVSCDEPALTLVPKPLPREFADAERAMLGFTHAEVGSAVLRQWNFPVTIVEPVRWQYTPLASAGYARMACLLHAAKWLRAVVCAEGDLPAPPLPVDAILHPLRLTGERLARLVVHVRVKLGSARAKVDFVAA